MTTPDRDYELKLVIEYMDDIAKRVLERGEQVKGLSEDAHIFHRVITVLKKKFQEHEHRIDEDLSVVIDIEEDT